MVSNTWSLPAERLEKQFDEKKPGFDRGEARIEASRCLYCYDAPCIAACPTEIDIPTFIRKIATGNLRGSARTILTANLLGKTCSTVCPVEVLCEGACVYVGWGRKPVEIGRLQRFALESAQSADLLAKAPASGKSVALVGGGPASLACAGALALLGHRPVIFEKNDLPGGLNVTGIAPYKLQAEDALEEAVFIRALGVEIQTGVEVADEAGDHVQTRASATIRPADLLDAYDAVFLGLGLGDDSFRGIPGGEGPGVIGGVEWIRIMKLDPKASVAGIESAIVVGGGNTALDVVQELAALGISNVRLVYRRSESEMPGYVHEWDGGKKLKVQMIENAIISEVRRGKDGAIEGVSLMRAEKGRATAEPLGDVDCDLIVVATGQERLEALARQFPGVTCDDHGRVVADSETMVTGNPRVFTGGDCYNGGKEVVNAAAEGQRAARAIDALLRT